jgi:molecular chaperone DnaK
VPQSLKSEVTAVLDVLDAERRRPFEARAAAWVAQARADVDQRFAGIWGLDLGTSYCAAAIYDTRTGRPVVCPWKGDQQFPSTLSIDAQGGEVIGVTGEEVLGDRLLGHISGSKQRMGGRTVFRIRDRSYRPEEVAARLIRHARVLVEDYLSAQVRERVEEPPAPNWARWPTTGCHGPPNTTTCD